MTLIKMIALWQGLKTRRESLNMTQPDMAEALGLSVSAYTHYETSGEGLTVERLMQVDGSIRMLERRAPRGGGKSVDNPVGKLGGKRESTRGTRIQDVLPSELPQASPTNPQKTSN